MSVLVHRSGAARRLSRALLLVAQRADRQPHDPAEVAALMLLKEELLREVAADCGLTGE